MTKNGAVAARTAMLKPRPPLALGSYWGLVPIAAMIPFLIWRLFDEERFLARNLPGYIEYQKRVRYCLVPFIW